MVLAVRSLLPDRTVYLQKRVWRDTSDLRHDIHNKEGKILRSLHLCGLFPVWETSVQQNVDFAEQQLINYGNLLYFFSFDINGGDTNTAKAQESKEEISGRKDKGSVYIMTLSVYLNFYLFPVVLFLCHIVVIFLYSRLFWLFFLKGPSLLMLYHFNTNVHPSNSSILCMCVIDACCMELLPPVKTIEIRFRIGHLGVPYWWNVHSLGERIQENE